MILSGDVLLFFFKQKTAYEVRISYWSSDVCSSDLPIRIVVPFTAGGYTDVLTRKITQILSPRLGQTIIVDNRPGAGSTLGTALEIGRGSCRARGCQYV